MNGFRNLAGMLSLVLVMAIEPASAVTWASHPTSMPADWLHRSTWNRSDPRFRIDLTGPWHVKLDPDGQGEQAPWFRNTDGVPIQLPGITSEAGLGEPLTLAPVMRRQVFQRLHQNRRYVGAAWYTRDFELPPGWQGQTCELVLERVMWNSTVWINGHQLKKQNSLSTSHRVDLSEYLVPGTNQLAIRIDNRDQVGLGKRSHAYTEQTQTIWNGIIGAIELQMRPLVSIQSLRVQPRLVDGAAQVKLTLSNQTSSATEQSVRLTMTLPNAPPILKTIRVSMPPGVSQKTIRIPTLETNSVPDDKQDAGVETRQRKAENNGLFWSEFAPNLVEVRAQLNGHEQVIKTGFRDVQSDQGRLWVNGHPTFLRGNVDCCIFPKTGYPSMFEDDWEQRFSLLKSLGLNHVRFHSWCPPEAAFAVADRLGIYLQVELPGWTPKMGQQKKVDQFFEAEGFRMIESYSHHPSLLLLSLGNELRGDFQAMDQLVARFRKRAPHLLLTSTSFSFSERGQEPGPEDDFLVTQRTKRGWVRLQRSLNDNTPELLEDYEENLEGIAVPVLSHEIGQYVVFPNPDEIPKYNQNLRSLALEAILANLTEKGRAEDIPKLVAASGKFALLLYKEEIERALRTPGLDGFQLLSLQDFPGQGMANVGLLDAFHEPKDLIDLSSFRQFCAPVVPLVRLKKRCWKSSETLVAEFEVANDSDRPLNDATLVCSISDGTKQIAASRLPARNFNPGKNDHAGRFELSLADFHTATRLTLTAQVEGTAWKNEWSVWVYPTTELSKAEQLNGIKLYRKFSQELMAALQRGERVLFLPSRNSIKSPINSKFLPIFWSPLHFPKQSPTIGTLIQSQHPVFDHFPTDEHSDWQWWELLANSTSVNLRGFAEAERQQPIMQFIDKFNRNLRLAILWETQVGRGKLLVCTLDIETDLQQRIVAASLRRSILTYMNSDRFVPRLNASIEDLKALFQGVDREHEGKQ